MKHIKRFNESKNNYESIIEDIFAEFLDNDGYIEHDENGLLLSFSIPTLYESNEEAFPSGIDIESYSLDRFLNYHTAMLEIYKDLEVCIKRLKDHVDFKSYKIIHHDGEIHENRILSYINLEINL